MEMIYSLQKQKQQMQQPWTIKGQSAVEIAVLGAVLLFVLSMLLRYGINFAESQNVQYRAFRRALQLSIEDSYALCPTVDKTTSKGSRIQATTVWIEDRPTVQGGEKYGAVSRTPYTAYGSGTLSTALQLPLEYDSWEGLPVIDMFINGQQFVFRTAWFRRFCKGVLCQKIALGPPFNDPAHWHCNLPDARGTYLRACLQIKSRDRMGNIAKSYEVEVDSKAPYNHGYNVRPPFITGEDLDAISHPHNTSWLSQDWTSMEYGNEIHGSVNPDRLYANKAFFTKILRQNKHFRETKGGFWAPLTLDELENYRFNLTGIVPPVPVPEDKRGDIAWQWFPVALSNVGINMHKTGFLQMDLTGDLKEETILRFACVWDQQITDPDLSFGNIIQVFSPHETVAAKRNTGSDDLIGLDADHITGGIYPGHRYWKPHPVNYVEFLDYQWGDWDTTYNQIDRVLFQKEPPGLVDEESRIRTIVPEAIFQHRQYMQDNQRIIISEQTREAYDIVERKIRLSRHTGCFCPAAEAPDNGYEQCLQDAGLQKTGSGAVQAYYKPFFCADDNLSVQAYCYGLDCCSQPSGTFPRQDVTCLEFYDRGDPNNPHNNHIMLYVRSVIGTKTGYRTLIAEDIDDFSY